MRTFEVCDNVDLEMMLLEFESYHYIKFQKYPKVVRKVTAGINPREGPSGAQSWTAALALTWPTCVCAAGSRLAGAVPQKRRVFSPAASQRSSLPAGFPG